MNFSETFLAMTFNQPVFGYMEPVVHHINYGHFLAVQNEWKMSKCSTSVSVTVYILLLFET